MQGDDLSKYADQIEGVLTRAERDLYDRAFAKTVKEGSSPPKTSLSDVKNCIHAFSGLNEKEKEAFPGSSKHFIKTYGMNGKMTKPQFYVYMRAGALLMAGQTLNEKNILTPQLKVPLLNVDFGEEIEEQNRNDISEQPSMARSTKSKDLEISPINDSDVETYLTDLRKVNGSNQIEKQTQVKGQFSIQYIGQFFSLRDPHLLQEIDEKCRGLDTLEPRGGRTYLTEAEFLVAYHIGLLLYANEGSRLPVSLPQHLKDFAYRHSKSLAEEKLSRQSSTKTEQSSHQSAYGQRQPTAQGPTPGGRPSGINVDARQEQSGFQNYNAHPSSPHQAYPGSQGQSPHYQQQFGSQHQGFQPSEPHGQGRGSYDQGGAQNQQPPSKNSPQTNASATSSVSPTDILKFMTEIEGMAAAMANERSNFGLEMEALAKQEDDYFNSIQSSLQVVDELVATINKTSDGLVDVLKKGASQKNSEVEGSIGHLENSIKAILDNANKLSQIHEQITSQKKDAGKGSDQPDLKRGSSEATPNMHTQRPHEYHHSNTAGPTQHTPAKEAGPFGGNEEDDPFA